ncbi:MAG: hypothetical protein ACLT29_08320 [Ruminococcus callidus]
MTETFVLESHHDRLLLHGLVVRPEQEPCRGILQVAHGMCEHKERYLPFLQEMADTASRISRPPGQASAAGRSVLLSGRRHGDVSTSIR